MATNPSLKDKQMDAKRKRKFVRWQNKLMNQLSYSINLFIGFSLVSLGYVIDLLLREEGDKNLLGWIVTLWSISLLFGCISTISRLFDFKYTLAKIRERGNDGITECLGVVTWCAFIIQVILYIFGAFMFIALYVFG